VRGAASLTSAKTSAAPITTLLPFAIARRKPPHQANNSSSSNEPRHFCLLKLLGLAMNPPVVHLVTNCTARKRAGGLATVRARDLGRGSDSARARRWIERLAQQLGPRRSATDLYAGEHWTSALKAAKRPHVQLWVVSAGYGLVPADAQLTNYDATFTFGAGDSVATTRQGQQEWWRELSDWDGPHSDSRVGRATLADLCATGRVIAALSEPYLWPLELEITSLDPADFLLVSTGCSDSTFAPYLLPANGAARMSLGGSLISVNVRVAGHVLSTVPGRQITRRRALNALETLRASTLPLPTFDRIPMDDEDVRKWIRDQRSQNPSLSSTGALKRLRAAGRACEQKRFGALFRQVVDESFE
jgi:hypothetical protein